VDVSSLRQWHIAYNDGAQVKLASSSNGFGIKTEADLMTGITSVRLVEHQLTGVMMIAGHQTATDKLVCYRSFDHGVTWDANPFEIVGSVDDQAFGLTCTPTAQAKWACSFEDGAGAIKTYWSTDNGLTWADATA